MKRLSEQHLERMAEMVDGKPSGEMAIPSYLHKNPALRWMAWRRLEVIAGYLQSIVPSPLDAVMDFGCGTGVLFAPALEVADRVIGVDLVLDAARYLVEAEKLTGVELLTPDQIDDELEPASIDVILASEVLEHIEDMESTMQSFCRCLKPGGSLLVSLPTEGWIYRVGRRLAGFDGHHHVHDARSIDAEIRGLGFSRTRRTRVPLPDPFAIYWVVEYKTKSADAPGESERDRTSRPA